MLRLVLGLLLALTLVGCRSDTSMPYVTGKKLDDAKVDIEAAGFDDAVDVDGGGMFGVVMESNWTVCQQSPAAGEPVDGTPRLTVARSCEGDEPDDESDDTPSDTASPSASAEPEEAEPEPSATSDATDSGTLTPQSNADVAALLKASDGCDPIVGTFADTYSGREIAFNGSIATLAPHDGYETRFDILVFPGDKGPSSTVGPNFRFTDKNAFDMNLTGPGVPEYIRAGQKYRFVAEVEEYDEDTCLLELSPVETKTR